MVVSCCVPSCKARGEQGFFQLPVDPDQRQKWRDILGLSDAKFDDATKVKRVCYRHFASDQINVDGEIRKLKKGRKVILCLQSYLVTRDK